jgi:hypothetical protein
MEILDSVRLYCTRCDMTITHFKYNYGGSFIYRCAICSQINKTEENKCRLNAIVEKDLTENLKD